MAINVYFLWPSFQVTGEPLKYITPYSNFQGYLNFLAEFDDPPRRKLFWGQERPQQQIFCHWVLSRQSWLGGLSYER